MIGGVKMIKRKNIDKSSRDTFVFSSYQPSAIAGRVMGIVPVKCQLDKFQASWGTVAGQACTIGLEKCVDTEAAGSGTACTAAVDATGTINTATTGAVVSGAASAFAAGDRVAVKVVSGTTTSLATFMAVAQFRPVD